MKASVYKQMSFKMTTEVKDKECLISIAGSLDTKTCAAAEQKIDNALSRNIEKISFDLKNLLYISSLGLRIFFKLAKQYPSAVKIFNVPEDVMSIFKMTGIDKTMSVMSAAAS